MAAIKKPKLTFTCYLLLTRLCLLLIIHQDTLNDSKVPPQCFYNCTTKIHPPQELQFQIKNSKIDTTYSVSETITSVYTWIAHRKRNRLTRHQLLTINNAPLHQRLSLLLISGIEPNPGPRTPRFPCTICKRACKTNQMSLACDNCDNWTHKDCVNMTTSSYIRLGNCVDQWYCPQCKSINNSGVYEIPTQLDSPSIRNTQPQTDPNHLNISTALSSIPSEVSTPRSKNSTENETRNSSSLSEAPQNADSMFLTSSPKPNVPSNNRKQSNNLRILNINFRSAKKKGKDLEAIIDTCNPDIIIGTETWLNPQIKSAEIISPHLGFDVYRRDRTDSYGGVMIAAKQELQLCDIEVSKSVELVHGNIKTREGKRMTLVAYY